MGPRQSRKSQPAIESESEEESQPVSTEEDTVDILQTAKGIVEEGKKRRENKRRSIEAEHSKRVKEVKTKIDKLFGVRKSRVTKNEKELWSKLKDLNAKRERLERQILDSMISIEKHTLTMAGEMEVVFGGRVQDIRAKENAEASRVPMKGRK